MVIPERIRKTHVLALIIMMDVSGAVSSAIRQAKMRTTIVRIAVATVESVSLIPHFASIAVTPAKKAEPNA